LAEGGWLRLLGLAIRRDLRLAWRDLGSVVLPVGFFAVVALLFPFAVGPDAELLRRLAAGIVWIAALLASLLSLDRIFAEDYADGSLERLLLLPLPLPLLVLGKAFVQWLSGGLPLTLAAPLLLLIYGWPPEAVPVLLLSIFLGTISLALLGTLGAALTLGARRGATLLPLILLPLTTPILIMGVLAAQAAAAGEPVRAHLFLLAAFAFVSLPLTAAAAPAALRQALD